jgi:hypothetical protein
MLITSESALSSLNSVPLSHKYTRETCLDHYERETAESSRSIFSITDKDYVCTLEMETNKLFPGESLICYLNFERGKQICCSVRASVVQSEMRFDDSIVQVICN